MILLDARLANYLSASRSASKECIHCGRCKLTLLDCQCIDCRGWRPAYPSSPLRDNFEAWRELGKACLKYSQPAFSGGRPCS